MVRKNLKRERLSPNFRHAYRSDSLGHWSNFCCENFDLPRFVIISSALSLFPAILIPPQGS